MNAQFHTPSFGDEDFDLSDCGLLPSSTGQFGGTGAVGGSNFMQQQHHQLQTKRVRNMEHTIDDYGSAHDDIGVYDTNNIATSTAMDMANTSNAQYVNCSGNNSAGIGGVGMNLNMNSTANITMGARKQLNVMTPSAATSSASSTAVAAAATTAATTATNATDPNEPVKPLSAYALFFHDTVSAIKPQNPNCSFQELTRIVASMWEALDPTHKNVYNKKNELARNEYLKQLRIYRQQQQEQQQQLQSNEAIQLQTKPAVFTITPSARVNSTDGNVTTPALNNNFATSGVGQQQTQYAQQLTQSDFNAQQQQQQQQPIFSNAQEQQQMVNGISNSNSNNNNNNSVSTQPTVTAASDPSPQQIQMLTEAGSVQKCTRENCNKRAIINPDWEDEYCSNECVVLHCRNVFNAWVKSNLEARKQ